MDKDHQGPEGKQGSVEQLCTSTGNCIRLSDAAIFNISTISSISTTNVSKIYDWTVNN